MKTFHVYCSGNYGCMFTVFADDSHVAVSKAVEMLDIALDGDISGINLMCDGKNYKIE